MSLHESLSELLDLSDEKSQFLSLYLDTSPDSEGRRTYDIFLKRRRKVLSSLAKEQFGPAGVREFKASLQPIERYLRHQLEPSTPAVALFSSAQRDFFRAVELPRSVRNKFVLSTAPNLDILIELVEGHGRYAVIVVDQHSGRMFNLKLDEGAPQSEELEESVPGRTSRGGWSQMRWQRHRQELIHHFMKEFARHAQRFDQRENPSQLVLLGTPDNLSLLRRCLPQRLLDKIVLERTIPDHRDDLHLAELVTEFVAAIEKDANRVQLSRYYDRLCQDHLAVAGPDETLFNLQMGRLETIFLTSQFGNARGCRCVHCGFLFSRNVGKCPYCRSRVEKVDLRNRIEKSAEHFGVQLQLVGSTSFLDELGGIGGLLSH